MIDSRLLLAINNDVSMHHLHICYNSSNQLVWNARNFYEQFTNYSLVDSEMLLKQDAVKQGQSETFHRVCLCRILRKYFRFCIMYGSIYIVINNFSLGKKSSWCFRQIKKGQYSGELLRFVISILIISDIIVVVVNINILFILFPVSTYLFKNTEF